MTEKQRERMELQKRERLPALVRALYEKRTVLFIDEAVFTQRSLQEMVWRHKHTQSVFLKNRLSFPAVAVIAAMD